MIAFVLLSLLFLLIVGMPIGMSMFVVAMVYFYLEGIPIQLVIQQSFSGADKFVLTAIPLFMFAGKVMNAGGITTRILAFCNYVVGRIVGGLAQVNILSSMIFAGMSGCAITDTAGLGSVLIPAMKKEGYSPEYSAAVTASSAVAGPIIPPSVPMIVTAAIASVSVGKLFVGAAIPGLLYGLGLMIVAYIMARKANYPCRAPMTVQEGWKTFKESIWGLLAPVIIIGGITSGVFTPTEAAAIAVVYALIVSVFIYREVDFKELAQMCHEAVISTSTIMFVVAMAAVYSYILTRERITEQVANFLFGLTGNAMVLEAIIVLAALLIGCFLSTTPAIMLFVPVVAPLVLSLPIDPIHFYVLVTAAFCLGTLTPPVGLNLYLSADLAQTSVEKVFRALYPFLLVMVVVLGLCILFPPLITWLPNMMYR
ncbi:TRAP transporter large permease [Desulfoscipio geothermicus]|uniref:TRAP transporter, DctM subunit n=1 Tax=Desulfoscipio geothermicus DSM 3669 TaxID=1121426 RepID=A0A1I6DEJ5_9FIRM|nr:TRAP transporter large permease [Desulfoscipio geothermicus]SFR03873.1 TRAP transporter, DctM subunit [Desulfoscipio geothermicus DSM 3669]